MYARTRRIIWVSTFVAMEAPQDSTSTSDDITRVAGHPFVATRRTIRQSTSTSTTTTTTTTTTTATTATATTSATNTATTQTAITQSITH